MTIEAPLKIGNLIITCRKPTFIEIYIRQLLNSLTDKAVNYQKPDSDFYFRRNGFNNDV